MKFQWTRVSGETFMAQTPTGVVLLVESEIHDTTAGHLVFIPGVEMHATATSKGHDIDLTLLDQKPDPQHLGPMPF